MHTWFYIPPLLDKTTCAFLTLVGSFSFFPIEDEVFFVTWSLPLPASMILWNVYWLNADVWNGKKVCLDINLSTWVNSLEIHNSSIEKIQSIWKNIFHFLEKIAELPYLSIVNAIITKLSIITLLSTNSRIFVSNARFLL